MITLKLHNYTGEQKKALLEIFNESLINLNDKCGADCDECSVKVICDDLVRAIGYLSTVCPSKE